MRHTDAHYYVNVGDGNVGTAIIHKPSRKPLQALSVDIAAKFETLSGGRLPPTGPKSTTRFGPKPKPLVPRVF